MILRPFTFDFCEKKRCHTPFFKKDATLCHLHLFLSRLLKKTLPPGHPPPSYLPGYLMLPNLTNQFIKLSDGDLQCEWNSDILKTFLWDIFLFTLWTFSFIGHFHGTKAKQHGDSFFRVYSWHLKEALLRKIHYLFCCSCKAITNK